jgi:choline dehydrogenase-like flavoprotein
VVNSDKGEPFVTVPGLAGGAVGTQYDWNISYVPTEYVDNRAIPIPLGKVVGGSTKLNRMVFDRGSKSDYDRWEDLGNEAWDWDALLPYFKKVGETDFTDSVIARNLSKTVVPRYRTRSLRHPTNTWSRSIMSHTTRLPTALMVT